MSEWTVLHTFYHYPPIISGYSKRSAEIVKHTAPFARSIIITPPLDKSKVPVKRLNDPAPYGEVIYRLRKPPLPPIKHIGHRLAARLFLEFLLRQVFRDHRIDLVHAHMPYLQALPTLRYAKTRGVKTLYEVRGVWEDSAVAEEKIAADSAKYRRRREGEEAAMKLADKVVVLSEALRNDIIARGIPSEKVVLVSNGVDCGAFTPRSHSNRLEVLYHLKGKFVIGYLGTLRKMEGIQTVISAMVKLLNQNEKIVFLIVGYGEYESELKRLAKDSNLGDHVVFTGAVPPDEAQEYYSVMDCVIFPRIRTRVTEIVTPLKPLEAMAMGKCVLGSRVGGLQEYLIEGVNAALFEPENVDQSVQVILRFAKDLPARQELGKKARRWVEENKDWKGLAHKYQELYSELTGARV